MKLFNLTFVLLFTSAVTFAQNQTIDIDKYVLEIKEFNLLSKKMKNELSIIENTFYDINKFDSIKTDLLLNELLRSDFPLKAERNAFFLSISNQLSTEQRQKVSLKLSRQLYITDYLYLNLVSKYNIKEHFSKILPFYNNEMLIELINQFESKSSLSEKQIDQLKILTTLANISPNDFFETKLLEVIKNLYSIILKSKQNPENDNNTSLKYLSLYQRILPVTIRELCTKKGVLETFYLMKDEYVLNSNIDIMGNNVSYLYLQHCVMTKLKLLDVKYLIYEHSKQRIKEIEQELRMNNNWLDFIR